MVPTIWDQHLSDWKIKIPAKQRKGKLFMLDNKLRCLHQAVEKNKTLNFKHNEEFLVIKICTVQKLKNTN